MPDDAMPRRHRARGREATELALQDAALRLMERDGVLAGLRLQDVAAEAGVSRALINHYFGNRQALLRAALASELEEVSAEIDRTRARPMADRALWVFKSATARPQYARMLALLALDGDTDFDVSPRLEDEVDYLRSQIEADALNAETDLEAMHAVLLVLALGWSLFREALALRVEVPAEDLDRRAGRVIQQMLQSLTPEDLDAAADPAMPTAASKAPGAS